MFRTNPSTSNVLIAVVLLVVLCSQRSHCFAFHGLTTRRGSSACPQIRHALAGDKNHEDSNDDDSLTVAIIGGGWAGFAAADAISSVLVSSSSSSSSNSQVLLLDASPRGPGGLAGAGWTTPKLQQPVEAGIHGFWREYRNTFDQMEKIGLDLDQVLTPYTPSLLVSSHGKVAVAPVLGERDEASQGTKAAATVTTDPLVRQIAQALPPPLDLALLAEYDESANLSVSERLSALGLLGVWADFKQEDPTSWERYDKISADQLFRSIAGVSDKLYSQLVAPLLHVLPMTTGYDCSAAAALSCFHVFALQSRGAFDVRWCRGSIAEKIFDPWVTRLTGQKNVQIRGSSKVTSIEYASVNGNEDKLLVNIERSDSKMAETFECDAVILAVGATAAKRLIQSCPPLQAIPGLSQKWKGLRGVTCVIVRLFLDLNKVPMRFQAALSDVPPVTVCGPKVGGIPLLAETGFCLYDLTRLQDNFSALKEKQNLLVLEVDFFRADDIAAISNDENVVHLALQAMEASLLGPSRTPVESELRLFSDFSLSNDMVVDFSVVRARNAVSHFCLGSAATSPDIRLGKGLYMCGDWVDRKGHSSWSTEKAVATGRQAAASLARDFGLETSSNSINVISPPQDTNELSTLRDLASFWRNANKIISPPGQAFFPRPPWSWR